MNVLRREIRECMYLPVEEMAGGKVARFLFPENFTGFKGHFPSGPILPGVCKIQALIVLAENIHKNVFELKEIREAKFFSTVSCNEEVVFEYFESVSDEGKATIKANATCGDRKIAKIELAGCFVSKKEETS